MFCAGAGKILQNLQNPPQAVIIDLTHKQVAHQEVGRVEYSQLYVQRIRSLCRAHGVSINRLAGISGVKQSTLDNIVRGLTKNPRVATRRRIALAFGMTLAEFLDFPELNDYAFEDDE